MSQRIAYGMDEAAETAGIGLTKLREEIAAKGLRARKLGSRTINGIFERLGRYEAALWRQVRQTIFTLQHLQWRAPGGRYRRTLDRWQR